MGQEEAKTMVQFVPLTRGLFRLSMQESYTCIATYVMKHSWTLRCTVTKFDSDSDWCTLYQTPGRNLTANYGGGVKSTFGMDWFKKSKCLHPPN